MGIQHDLRYMPIIFTLLITGIWYHANQLVWPGIRFPRPSKPGEQESICSPFSFTPIQFEHIGDSPRWQKVHLPSNPCFQRGYHWHMGVCRSSVSAIYPKSSRRGPYILSVSQASVSLDVDLTKARAADWFFAGRHLVSPASSPLFCVQYTNMK